MTISEQIRFPNKQCRNGHSFACNHSKEIKTRLSSEAIQKLTAIIKYRATKPYKGKIYVVWFKRNCVDIGL